MTAWLLLATLFCRVAIVTFGLNPTLVYNLDAFQTSSEAYDAIRFLPHNPSATLTARALDHVADYVLNSAPDRPHRDNVVVLLTDGPANDAANLATASARVRDYTNKVCVATYITDIVASNCDLCNNG